MASPAFFKLRVEPGSAAWEALPPEPRAAWLLHRELDKTQWISADELRERQLAEARLLLSHCAQHVPFIREQLKAAAIEPADIRTIEDFRRIPICSRLTWQEHADDLRARQLPADTSAAGTSITSGSSGVPLEVLQTNIVRRWWWACNLRDLQWGEINPLGKLAAIRSRRGGMNADDVRRLQDGEVWPVWFPGIDPIVASGLAYAMDIVQDPRKQLDWLLRVSPNYLLSYPSNLETLARLARDRGVVLPELRIIQTVSETLTDEAQQTIESAFGVPVKNGYSCAEVGYLASPCPAGHGLHVHAEHALLEVLDEQDRPCAAGETGRVVLTALHNYLSPFVRYAIGDYATVGPAQCPCGRGLPLLTRVEGKRRPLFQLPNGKSKNSDALVYSLRLIGGMLERQMIQRARDHIVIRVVPDQHWTPAHLERVRQAALDFFETPVHVDVQVLDRMDRAPRGKLVDAICEVAPLPRPASSAKPPKCVLIASDMGVGSAPASRLLLLARAIANHGHRPVLVVRDLQAFRDQPFEIVPIPIPESFRPQLAASHADVLAAAGFASVEELLPKVTAWRGLLDQFRPALVICENCPTLQLAMLGSGATVVIGDGFAVPPADGAEFPLLTPGRPPVVAEAKLLQVVTDVQRRCRRPVPRTLPGLFAVSTCFVTALSELDPYTGERRRPVAGPLELLPAASPPPASPRLLADLRADAPGVESLLIGIAQIKIPAWVHLRGASPQERDRLRQMGLDMLDHPPQLHEVIPHASAIIHHGESIIAQCALAAGRPQLLQPLEMSHLLTAQLLHGRGVGNYLLGDHAPDIYRAELGLLTNPSFVRHASDAAFLLRGEGRAGSLPRILSHCLSWLRGIRSN